MSMPIYEALQELGSFITMLFEREALSDVELAEIEKIESAIHTYVCEKGDM